MGIKCQSPLSEVERHERAIREFLAREPFGKSGLTDEQLQLFRIAFTHDSFSSEALNFPEPCDLESYERLEFLGDAILEFIACEDIYLNSELKEGRMTDFKQEIVANRKISQKVKERFDFDDLILIGHGHRDPRTKENIIEENIRADVFEAFIGASYISFGMDETKRFVKEILW